MSLPSYTIFRVCHILNIAIIVVSVLSCSDDDEPPVAEVTSITPASALPNSVVAITGKDFSTVFNENIVSFNGKDALVLNASSTQLNVVVPAAAVTGPVIVTVRGKQARNQPAFNVERFSSIISNVSPLLGGYNTVVTITGSNFLATPADNTVTFNGVLATVESATSTSLTVKVPERAGSGQVIVNGVAGGVRFTYVPDVYIVGHVHDKDGFSRATYWKNGIPTTLGAAGQSTQGLDIALAGDDVYVTGFKALPSFNVARCWKNGTEILLSDDKYASTAEAISISGNDVYIAGSENNSLAKPVAKYWKNGTPVTLTDGTSTAYATGIGVNGQDVYVAGNSQDSGGISFATYWKNGTPHHLSTINSYGWSMFLSGNDIYVTGSERNIVPGIGFVTYWKNDVISRISPGLTGGAGFDIVVSGNNVYVAGVEDNAKYFRVAKYWKNGLPVSLSDGSTYAVANAIDVIGEDVYVVGGEYNPGGVLVAKMWKNGVPFPITDGGYLAIAQGLILR
jgi:hypothetical protein